MQVPGITQVGGCFCPPITKEQLSEYMELARVADPDIRDAMYACARAVYTYLDKQPEKVEGLAKAHAVLGTEHKLTEDQVNDIWDDVPYLDECKLYDKRFERLDGKSKLAYAAQHLLWYAKELAKDRHPIFSYTEENGVRKWIDGRPDETV